MSRRIVVPRRTFLRGMSGLGLGLPLFESLGCAQRDARELDPAERTGVAYQREGKNAFPKRILFWYTPNGNYDIPTPGLEGMWSPLQAFAPYSTYVKGMDMTSLGVWHTDGEPHQFGMCALTGKRPNPGDFVGGDGSRAGWGSGISVDQEIANAIGTTSKAKSIVCAVHPRGSEVRHVLSYTGSDSPIIGETNPYNLYQTLFSQLGADPMLVEATRKRRKSVLDLVDKQYADVSKKLSRGDRDKLDKHLTSVRDVESRLNNSGGVVGGNCQRPDQGDPIDLEDANNFGVIGDLFIDMIAMAFACDITRVGVLQWSSSANNRPYPFLSYNGQPIMDDEHALSHAAVVNDGVPAPGPVWDKIRIIKNWYNARLERLLAKLDSMPEGEGTVLDNTIVVLFSEITYGFSHSNLDLPFGIYGKGGGALKGGQFLDYPDRYHNDLLVTLLNIMGVEATTFGDPDYVTGPLSDMMV